MGVDEIERVLDDLAATHGTRSSGRELADALHQTLLRIRPHHHEALSFVASLPPASDATTKASRADVLGEVCNGDPQHIERALPLLAALSTDERRAEVVVSIATALGKLWDPRSIPLLIQWADHPDGDVRLAVAGALHGTMVHESNPDAVHVLVALSRDRSPEVRDWATFALGSSAATGDDVDRALLDRLDDEDPDTRAEAFMALAARGDERMVEPLIDVFTSGSVGTLEVRAAATSADIRLHPALVAMAEWWGDSDRGVLDQAIDRCDPSLRGRAASDEQELLRAIRDALDRQGISQLDVTIEGAYPDTDFVLKLDGKIERSKLWAYDDESPRSLDREFTVRRVVNLAASLVADGGKAADNGWATNRDDRKEVGP